MLILGLMGVAVAFGLEPLALKMGKDYAGIGRIAVVMAVMPMAVGVGGVQGQMGLIAMGGEKEKKTFRNIYLIAGILSLCCVLVMSNIWGGMGAAVALSVTEGFVCIAMCVSYRKMR